METPEEQEVRKKLELYQETISTSQSADKAALAMAAMEETMQAERVATKKRRWAYLIALAVPPIGIVIAFYYYFSKKADGKRVAWITLILSIAGFVLLWLSMEMFKAAIPATLQTQLNDMDVKELQDLLKEYQ
jgi:uncharacterized membrane-anchored protein